MTINPYVLIKIIESIACTFNFASNITIENAEVVSKSYPSFWEDLGLIGCEILSSN
jgi:5-enolpyruvylshikimate-3-phosphate synthase